MTYPNTLPKVSIITPAFNSVKTIELTIQSVLGQYYPNLEHIVVDGGSTDGTIELLKRYPHLRWISERDEGQSDALNKGFSLANGEILGWLNADDTYNPGAVRSSVAYLDDHPHVAMVYSNCNHIDEQGQLIYYQRVPPFDLATELIDFQIPQPTVFFRKEMIQQVGQMDTRLHYVMDWAWFLRLGARYPIGYVDETWANFRVWADTKTTQHPEKFWQEILSFFDEFFQDPELPTEVQAVRDLAYARAYWVLGCIYYGLLISKGIEILERGSLLKALKTYPLLKQDRNFAIDQIVHWAVSQLEMDQVENYLSRLFEEISMVESGVRRSKRKVLGHIYASSFLTREKKTTPALEDNKLYLDWIIKAISYDPAWLFNRGIHAGLFQLVRQKFL
jgi:glycosyltransferase involved in cell wall biosynthesis